MNAPIVGNQGKGGFSIILNHEDVGRWSLINSSFLRRRYYSFVEHRHHNQPHALQGRVLFPDEDVEQLGGKPDSDGTFPHSMDDQDRANVPGLVGMVTGRGRPTKGRNDFLIDVCEGYQANSDNRHRGVVFQLGTFPGEDPDGAHVDFTSIQLRSGVKVIEAHERGKVFWVNILDKSIERFPMNAFHATYWWPTNYFRGPGFANAEQAAKVAFGNRGIYLRRKLIHTYLALNDRHAIRPPREDPPEWADGAIMTYWSGKDQSNGATNSFNVAVGPQPPDAGNLGFPDYTRQEFTIDRPSIIEVYDRPAVDLTRKGVPTQKDVDDLIGQKPTKRWDSEKDGVTSVVVMSGTHAAGHWTHGGVHDPGGKP